MITSTTLALHTAGATGTERRPRGGTDGFVRAERDRCLGEHVRRGLLATGHWLLRGVSVSVRDRTVTLRGRVPSYYLKQLAQTAALAAPGLLELRNELSVAASPAPEPL
ncbi:BON domain-containing protein [Frigoriglobus tundricola]|uniref:BON domain-containing protein n=1 Tax=Frigoriglobus tundricola TaxID=2774151 RepID=A0A6M5YPT6_9BACT|nr:BON domain-containing protein [Frigoriglobus tundricola]QJW94982.1 hypothetical protein FTUN_2508 [Frigoriglobus tundricola]